MPVKKRPAAEPSLKDDGKTVEERRAMLASLGRSSHVTQSGIEGLLNDVQRHGMPIAFSRRSQ